MKTARSVVGVEPTSFRIVGLKSMKTNALTDSATEAFSTHSVQCTLYSAIYIVYSVSWSVYNVMCTVHIVHSPGEVIPSTWQQILDLMSDDRRSRCQTADKNVISKSRYKSVQFAYMDAIYDVVWCCVTLCDVAWRYETIYDAMRRYATLCDAVTLCVTMRRYILLTTQLLLCRMGH